MAESTTVLTSGVLAAGGILSVGGEGVYGPSFSTNIVLIPEEVNL